MVPMVTDLAVFDGLGRRYVDLGTEMEVTQVEITANQFTGGSGAGLACVRGVQGRLVSVLAELAGGAGMQCWIKWGGACFRL